MKPWMIIVLIVICLLVAAAFRVRYELRHLQTASYILGTSKLSAGQSVRAVFLTDLHSRKYGTQNEELLSLIAEQKPDLILAGGDMLTAKTETGITDNYEFFHNLLQTGPVYAAPGNHEKRLSLDESGQKEMFEEHLEQLEKEGLHYLTNTKVDLSLPVSVYGMDLDFRYYKKLRRQYYEPEQMKKDLASFDDTRFNIVLAHNPRFFKTYAGSGADLFLAGHYHGGAVRIGRKIGLISPQFIPFPRYSRGLYRKGETTMIVSAGCGSHKVNLRLFNKPEIVVIDIHGPVI